MIRCLDHKIYIVIMQKKGNTLRSLNNIKDLPVIPDILIDVVRILKNEPGNTSKLSQAISKDQGITARLLNIANSPLYGVGKEVSSIEFAIMLLGSKEVESIVTAISLSDALKFNSEVNFNYMDYWKHSMIVGLAARDVARRLGNAEYSGEAFLSGMLHDLGIQLIVRYFPHEYNEILKIVNAGNSYLDAEKDLLGLTHQEIGKFLAQKWNLPNNLIEVIEYHHSPSKSQINKFLVSIVHMIDDFTREFNIDNAFWDSSFTFDTNVYSELGFQSKEEFGVFKTDYEDILRDIAESIVN